MTPPNVTPMKFPADQTGEDPLVYSVELWTIDQGSIEQVLARASSMTLARATFGAAQKEHPGRHIVLRHGPNVVETT